MRQANVDDIGVIQAMSLQAGVGVPPDSLFEKCLVYIGDHGFIIFDIMDDANCIAHVTVTKGGRGRWSRELFQSACRWAFTSTRIEMIRGAVPNENRPAIRLGEDAWFVTEYVTEKFTHTHLDIFRWIIMDQECFERGASAASDFEFADNEMIRRMAGACMLMREAGMEHKAWYIYQLYAKLFGYKAEG
jgi:hypothetical protein